MRSVRNVSVVLSAKVDRYKADMATAAKAATDAATKTETAWDKSQTGMGRAMRGIQKYEQEMSAVGGVMTGFGAVVVGAFGMATKSAMSWESAWTGVLKTVDGSARELADLQKGLRGLSRELPATHEEIAGVAEAAGQLGVETGNIVSFTKTMVNMGEATNLSAEEAATSLARFGNIMGSSQNDFGKMGAAVVGLGNNFATTEGEIVAMSMRIAGAGKQAGMTEGDVLGLATALSSVGIDAEAGGTAISMVMKKMGNAVEEGGSQMETFASVSGMTSKEFASAWEDDAAGAMSTFVTGLGAAQDAGQNVNGTLETLGITGIRESDALLRLSNASDVLKDALATGNDEYAKGIALMIEAEQRYETAESKIRIAGNSIRDSAIDIGATFLPAVAGAADGVAELAEWIGKLPKPVLQVGAGLGTVAGATTLAAGGFLLLAPKIVDTLGAINTLRDKIPDFNAKMGKAGKVASVAAVGIAAVATAAIAASEALKNSERQTESSKFMEAIVISGGNAQEILKGINREMEDVSKVGKKTGDTFTSVDNLAGAFDRLYDSTFSDKINTALGWIPGVESGADKANAAFKNLDTSVTDLAEGGSLQAAQDGFKAIMYEGRASGVSLQDTFSKFPEYKQHLESVAESSGMVTNSMSDQEREAILLKIAYGEITPAMLEAGAAANGNEDDLVALGVSAQTTEEKISSLADEIRNFGSETLSVREANRQVEQGWDDLQDAIDSGKTSLDDSTEAGRRNNELLDSQVRKIHETTASNLEAGDTAEEAAGKHEKLRDKLVKQASAFFDSKEDAEAYVDSVLKTPEEIETDVKINTGDANAKLKTTKQWMDSIKDKTVWVKVNETHIRQEGNEKVYSRDPTNIRAPKAKHDGGVLSPMASGGIMEFYAQGGLRPMDPIAEMVHPNTWRVVGDRMDVDEAYVPLDGTQRSWQILAEAFTRMPGVQPMASGGIVGSAERKLESAQNRLDAISDSGRETTAKERRRDRAQAEVDRARDELDKAREREEKRERLAALRDSLRVDVRRGDMRERVTSGLSGGYSTVDELARLGENEDLSRGSRSKASSAARKFEADLKSLYGQADRIDEKLEDAKKKADELQGIKDSVTNSLLGQRDLDVGTFQTMEGGQWSSHSNLGQAAKGLTMDVGAMKSFAAKLKKLVELGIPGEIVQEIAQAGPEAGSNMADSFLDATKAERQSYLGAWKDYEKYANQAGQYVTEGFEAGGAEAANGVVKGLEGKKKNVEKAIANLAKVMESTFKSVLGIHSPSRVTTELGAFTGQGYVLGLEGQIGAVSSAASRLGAAAVPNMMAFDTPEMSMDVGVSPVVQDDEGAASLAMRDMSTSTLESMELMKQAVAEGWTLMLTNTQAAQAGMLLDTQTNQAGMLSNIRANQYGMLTDVQANQSGMRANVQANQSGMLVTTQDKQLSMLTNTRTQFEAMRSSVAGKQSETRTVLTTEQEAMRHTMAEKQRSMRIRNSEEFESLKQTTHTKLRDTRSGSSDIMEGFKTDYSGHLGSLKRSNRSAFESMHATSDANFRAIRRGMDSEMGNARPELGGNLNSLIDVFGSFTDSVNKAFGDVGIDLDSPKRLNFATGGVMPGYSPGRDIHQFSSPTAGNLFLSGGEAIMRPEFTRSVGGEAGVEALNKAARHGRQDELTHLLGGAAFASGGVYDRVPGVNAFADSGVWRNLWAMTKEQFPNARLTSAYRGGSITASGNRSHHARGNAIDVSPSMDIFNWWRSNHGANLAELIYSPANGKQIKNGNNYMYQGAVRSMHYDHVHIAALRALSEAMAGGLPGMGGEMSHPFLDRAGVSPGGDMQESYEEAAKKLSEKIIAKHTKMLPDGIGGDLGVGIMDQIQDGLIEKAGKFGKTAGTGSFSNIKAGPAKAMAKQMLEQMGWGDQFDDLDWLLTRESGWNPNAQNPTSTAYGMFQFLDSTWGTVGGTKTSDPQKQLEYGLKYIKQRYGDVAGARSFWSRNNWYEGGAKAAQSGLAVVGENGPELVDLRGSERIHNAQQTRKMLAENRTFVPNSPSNSAMSGEALGRAVAEAVRSNGISANDLASALNGVQLTFNADGQQFTGAVTSVVGKGYSSSQSRLSKSSQKIGAR